MIKLALALMLTAVPLHATAARPGAANTKPKPSPAYALQPKPPKKNPCAEYGAGFIMMEGSSTCIRIGGSIGVGIGGGR